MEDNTSIRKNLGVKVTEEERSTIDLILTRKETASALDISPSITDQATKDAYYKAAITVLGDMKFLEKNWWKSTLAKYEIVKNFGEVDVFVDTSTGELYTLEEGPRVKDSHN